MYNLKLILLMGLMLCCVASLKSQPKPSGLPIGFDVGDVIDSDGFDAGTDIFSNSQRKVIVGNQSFTKLELVRDKFNHSNKYVRINIFRPDNNLDPNSFSWLSVYENIVNKCLASGIKVYVSVNERATSMRQYPRPASENEPISQAQRNFINEYAKTFKEVVNRFRNKVQFFESYNEPNNWQGSRNVSKMQATAFAELLTKVYDEVKAQDSNWWQYALISGPILVNDGTVSGPIDNDYFLKVINYGKSNLDWFKNSSRFRNCRGKNIPMDDIGVHFYIQEHNGDVANINTDFQNMINRTWNSWNSAGTFWSGRKLFVSEFGFNSNTIDFSSRQNANNFCNVDELQAYLMARAVQTIRDNHSKIDFALYFQLATTGEGDFGLIRDAAFSFGKPSKFKTSYYVMKNILEDSSGNIWQACCNAGVPPWYGNRFTDICQTTGCGSQRATNDNEGQFSEQKSLFAAYPNPFNKTLQVGLKEKNGELKIYDMAGRAVIHQKLQSKLTIINTKELQAGCYLIEVESNGNIQRQKIIKH